ncbi:uncharacterized protein LOC114263537 [Camellia sinensis]|uniref:uncharacterized protein LOC114263537 n=1 Tax=Camellia sinensis TaxID=4442 RepID=UPI0010368F41|nr:uncharacterized protein LOC114263537 [Camellia sinensis]
MEAVPSTYHQLIRFPTKHGVEQISRDQVASKHYFMAALKAKQLCNRVQMVEVAEQPVLKDVGGIPEEKMVEDLDKVLVKEDDPEKYFLIGLDPEFACHKLNINPSARPIVQKSQRSSVEHTEAVIADGEKLLASGAIREVQGIEANPDQIKAIQDLEILTKAKELQKLARMAAALNRFISKFSDRMKPFFQLLKKRAAFEWSSECTKALQILKKYLSTPPLLSTPELGEELYLYLAVSDHTVSTVLIRKVNKEQRPVYYVCKTLLDAETRTVIKAQVLADFISKFAPTQSTEPGNPSSAQVPCINEQGKPCTSEAWKLFIENIWQLYVDGSSNNRGSEAGVVLISTEVFIWEQALRLGWKASNNETEYESLLAGLRSAEHFSAAQLLVFSNSQLVVNQLFGVYETRDERMAMYAGKAKDLLKKFQSIRVERISQDKNGHADSLACLGSSVDTKDARKVWVEFVPQPSIASPVLCSSVKPSWMDPILAFLKSGAFPEEKKEANKVRHKSARFWISPSRKLYRRSYIGPYLLCVHPNLVENVLYEIHDGICGCHVGGRSLAHRALTHGYWWPQIQQDAQQYVQKCDKCQRPLARGTRNKRFFIAATDYFTKWVEVEALVNIKEADTKQFVMTNVVVRFGIPRVLIADNGTQFDGKWVEELPHMLWAYGMETPYSLTYGMEAVISLEVGLPTLRFELFESTSNEEAIAQALDMAEGRREAALIKLVAYQQQLIKSFNQKVFPRQFTPGELVLRKVMDHKKVPGEGKPGPNWEGPYKITVVVGNGAYYLEDLNGSAIPRPWNVANLKKCYQ